MSLNSQHKRVSKNRVSITYDVETNGAVETKELPFVVGVIGDFSGHKPDSEKVALEEREFTGVDKDNFDSVMGQIHPRLSYKVDNKLAKDDTQFDVNLSFRSMKDFHPENLVEQIDPLKQLVETRNQLKVLLSKADRSRDLESLLKEVLQSTDAINGLAEELGLNQEGGE
ncbi:MULTISPECIES: type VI secretion system contractile sheath small subunit [Vibrio]|jgi:type VI secretion system protein ImpB|uniref:Type VI secretion system contractile sheath small subunit n=1 Tax=Vibrio atlanticus TaxID=693153 RepID=A0A1C3IJB0_9VIBR|nr:MULTISPECIES: type VI secretion system contractile sheath small subunit [Vibrio]KPL97735.1 type VI secretion protein [Vibrio splendidus]MCC4790756.1 type VI secretion system contractile sheath small subunit [Vibrio splendidus]MCC4860902.1 type VI secretion system contractile sheath small subunit [Vibrio splendidus]MDP2592554.1 type VI secretion system contractile sheath small subunit [Vibrio splendidus]OEE54314.1 type VI secretion system-associated protein [Vibrio splendidus FF-500]